MNINPSLIMVAYIIEIIISYHIYNLGDSPPYLYVILKGSVVVLEKSLSSPIATITDSFTPESQHLDQSNSSKSLEKLLSRIKPKINKKDYSENESVTILKSLSDLHDTQVDMSKINHKRNNFIISKESNHTEPRLNNNNHKILDSFDKVYYESAISPTYQNVPNFYTKNEFNIAEFPKMKIKYQLAYGNYFGEIVSNNCFKK